MPESTPTILIIDNDDGLVAAITTRLEACGYQCVKASTGAQGIRLFQEECIDLVITDLNMPVGNGIALAKTLRASSDVPIIVVTGYRGHFARELRSIPNVTVLEKPFDSNELLDLVETDLALTGRNLPYGIARNRKTA